MTFTLIWQYCTSYNDILWVWHTVFCRLLTLTVTKQISITTLHGWSTYVHGKVSRICFWIFAPFKPCNRLKAKSSLSLDLDWILSFCIMQSLHLDGNVASCLHFTQGETPNFLYDPFIFFVEQTHSDIIQVHNLRVAACPCCTVVVGSDSVQNGHRRG